MFRNENDIDEVLDRIVPQVIRLDEPDWETLADFVSDAMDELKDRYIIFLDQAMGPIRQRAGELHTAVVGLSARLLKGEIDTSWLPRHTFIVLSQIQGHAASLMEDLDSEKAPPDSELEAMDNSLDSMVDAFTDTKEMIDEAMNSYRRSNLQIIRFDKDYDSGETWQTVQISLGGTDIWRRALIPGDKTLEDLHKIIQIGLDWKGVYGYCFYIEGPGGMDRKNLDDKMKIKEACDQGYTELQYEYGNNWNVKAILLSPHRPGKEETMRFVAGEDAAPPETIGGPLRFRKMLGAIETGGEAERQAALKELGPDFDPGVFDMDKCNRDLDSLYLPEK
jgi:hypothetical protein